MQQSLIAYRSYQKLIEDCACEIRRGLEQFHPPDSPPASTSESATASPPTNTRSSEGVLRAELQPAFGIDLTQIPGIRTGIAPTLFGEIGPDFTKFRSASAFASWMGLCPDNEISGGKGLWVGTRQVNCRAATALRMVAQSLHHSQSARGDFYRRMRAKLGAPKAITAPRPQISPHHLPPRDHPPRIRRPSLCRCPTPFSQTSGSQTPRQSASPRIPTYSLGTGGMNGSLRVPNRRCAGQNGKELRVMHGAVK